MSNKVIEARKPLVAYKGYEYAVYRDSFGDFCYKVLMTIGAHKKVIKSRQGMATYDFALQKCIDYIDMHGEERMKRGFEYRGVRYLPEQKVQS